jgi:excinuclease ABC subunit C
MFLEGRTKELVAQLDREMAEASEREDFELAGMLRDRVHAVGALHEDQAVIAPSDGHADVLGLSRSGSYGCLVLLAVREGKLIGKQEFTVRRAHDVPDAELVGAFLEQHYAVATPPARILLPCELENLTLIDRWLAGRREGGTELLSPRSGLNRELLDLAEANAKASLVSRGRVGVDEATEQLACATQVLELSRPPSRLEAVDLSHLHGEEAVGAVVVFREGLPSNREHRRYLIKTARGGDDYASMHEVVLRRLKRLKEEGTSLPDLMLLDGGAGQLKAAAEACREAGVEVPLAALAKREELLYLPGRDLPVTLPSDSPALHLLQRARDEAHRYVNAYQRRRRKMVLREGAQSAKRAMKRVAASAGAGHP